MSERNGRLGMRVFGMTPEAVNEWYRDKKQEELNTEADKIRKSYLDTVNGSDVSTVEPPTAHGVGGGGLEAMQASTKPAPSAFGNDPATPSSGSKELDDLLSAVGKNPAAPSTIPSTGLSSPVSPTVSTEPAQSPAEDPAQKYASALASINRRKAALASIEPNAYSPRMANTGLPGFYVDKRKEVDAELAALESEQKARRDAQAAAEKRSRLVSNIQGLSDSATDNLSLGDRRIYGAAQALIDAGYEEEGNKMLGSLSTVANTHTTGAENRATDDNKFPHDMALERQRGENALAVSRQNGINSANRPRGSIRYDEEGNAVGDVGKAIPLDGIRQISNMDRANNSITELRDRLNKLDQWKRNPGIGQTLGFTQPINKEIALVQQKITSLLPTLARGVYGEVGVLTEADMKRYNNVIPQLGTKADVAAAMLDGLLADATNAKRFQLDSYRKAGYDVRGFDESPEPGSQPAADDTASQPPESALDKLKELARGGNISAQKSLEKRGVSW